MTEIQNAAALPEAPHTRPLSPARAAMAAAASPATGHAVRAAADAQLAAVMAYAEPSASPPTVAELEQACIDAYAAMVAAHRRLTTAEIRHRDAVKASLQAGRS